MADSTIVIDDKTLYDNVLHNYASYTYNITLAGLTVVEFNNLPDWSISNVYIASGGKYADKRNEHFANTNFFIDDLVIKTAIGANAKTQMSNVIDITFKIIEPLGLTLLARLDFAAKTLGKSLNYLNAPLMMFLSFSGYDDDGILNNQIDGCDKGFSIILTGCQIQITSKGTEYSFTAKPYDYCSLSQANGVIPASMSPYGTTIEDIFGTKQTSFTTALNSYYTSLVEQKIATEVDTVAFDFENFNELYSSNICRPDGVGINQTPIKDASGNAIALPAFAGTTILNYLCHVIHHSDYIVKQLDPRLGELKTVNWYKVIPQVTLKEKDEKLGRLGRNTTYIVTKFELINTQFPTLPLVVRSLKVYKDYNYLFTGKNKDILDMQLQMNALFYIAMTPNQTNNDQLNYNNGSTTAPSDAPQDNKAGAICIMSDNAQQPVVYTNQLNSATNVVSFTPEEKQIEDFTRRMFDKPSADLTKVEIKIIGDPVWIKQDTRFKNATKTSGTSDYKTSASIEMDEAEVFIRIKFNSPSDYNMETGGVESKYDTESMFTGIYRVNLVESRFSKGKFDQTLTTTKVVIPQAMVNDVQICAPQTQAVSDVDLNHTANKKTLSDTKSTVSPNVLSGILPDISANSRDMALDIVKMPLPSVTDQFSGPSVSSSALPRPTSVLPGANLTSMLAR